MKKNIFIVPKAVSMRRMMLLMTLFFAVPSYGQDIIYEENASMAEYSIIRHYKNDIDITFDLEGGWLCFTYTDRSTQTIKLFDVGFEISDFEISNGILYFCGYHNGSGLFGWFDIDSVFLYGTGHVFYNIFSNAIFSPLSPAGIDLIVLLKKIEIVEDSKTLHLLMTGIGCMGEVYSATNMVSLLMEVTRWNGTNSWSIKYTMDYSQTISYDDLCMVERKIVVAGRYDDGTSIGQHAILSYDWTNALANEQSIFDYTTGGLSTYNQTLFLTPYTLYSVETGVIMSAYDPLQIVSMNTGDAFATACIGQIPGDTLHIVNIYMSPVSNPVNRFGFKANGYYQSMAYNDAISSIYLITKKLPFIYRSTSPFNSVYEGYSGNLNLFSVDAIPSSPKNVVSCSEPPSWRRRLWLYD